MDECAKEERIWGIPRIGDPAPDFEAETTFGVITLDSFKGSWLVLFSHPADFTPICTTEFIEFAKNNDEFEKLGIKLLGLSIDGIYSHIAWVLNIKDKFGIDIPFPIIADFNASVANRYGMIMPGDGSTATSRCLFVIDPDGIVRAMIYYPLTTGRNIPEVLRLVKSLQTSDRYLVGTPANWNPGDLVVEYPPRTQDAANALQAEKGQCQEWYYCRKQL
ncbi:MAG: peroxiredoxin [Pseudomonadota bacterium]